MSETTPSQPTEGTETPLWEQGESPTDTLDRWIAEGSKDHINLRRDALKRLRARLTGEAQGASPFKLPVRVVALLMPDAWAVYDAAGNLVAETYEREHADFIAAAINADAPTAKAESPFKLQVGVVDDPASDALDSIVKILGGPEWDYPGQVVRDVAMAVGMTVDQFRDRLNADEKPAPWPNSDTWTAKAPSGGEGASAEGQEEVGSADPRTATPSAGVPTPDEPATKCPDCGAAHRPSRGCPRIGGSEPEGEATDDA